MDEIKGMTAGIMRELKGIRKENKEFKDEMMQMKRENDELQQEINSLRSRVVHLYAMEEKMEKLDRQARKNNILVSGSQLKAREEVENIQKIEVFLRDHVKVDMSRS
nr:unnamed protein product [Callosobruchus analis]